METLNLFSTKQTLEYMSEEHVFILKKKDTEVLTFKATLSALGDFYLRIESCVDDPSILPRNFEKTPEYLHSWLRSRFVPKNRAFVEKIIGSSSMSGSKILELLKITKALSLIDDYWVVFEGEILSWSEHNLYTNDFSETLALVAFTGYGKHIPGIASSPEYTTDGMLRKAWRRIDGNVYLYKGGTEGYANSGNEPFSEYYASQVAEALGITNYVPYDLEKWKGVLCSTCKLFTSEDISYVNALTEHGQTHISDIMLSNSEYHKGLSEMLVFDFIILNTDRHFGNFGYLRNNSSGDLVGLAPIFDNGSSLLCYAMKQDLLNVEEYINTLSVTFGFMPPSNSFPVKVLMGKGFSRRLRKLLSFEFKKHPKYNLDDQRLNLLSSLIRKRTAMLL